MAPSSTNVPNSALTSRLFRVDPPANPRNPQFKASGSRSERQLAGVTSKSAEQIPGFFESIANRIHSWRKNLAERALNKSTDRAASEISNGLCDHNFRRVYQGTKRLHYAARQHSRKTNGFDDKSFVLGKLKGLVSKIESDKKHKIIVPKLAIFNSIINDLVERHSDRHTRFHRMLTRLARVGLVSDNYVKARLERIKTLDTKIEISLRSMLIFFLKS